MVKYSYKCFSWKPVAEHWYLITLKKKKKKKSTGVKGWELAHQTEFHCGKSTDSNNRKMPGLGKQIWITSLDNNSHYSKVWKWERKQVLPHIQSQVIGRAHTPPRHLGLGAYQNVPKCSRRTHWGPSSLRPEGPSGHCRHPCGADHFLLNLALSLFPPTLLLPNCYICC